MGLFGGHMPRTSRRVLYVDHHGERHPDNRNHRGRPTRTSRGLMCRAGTCVARRDGCVTNYVTTRPYVSTAPRTPTDITSPFTCTFLPIATSRRLLHTEEVGGTAIDPDEAAARQHHPRQPPSRPRTRRHVPADQAADDDTAHQGVTHQVLIDTAEIGRVRNGSASVNTASPCTATPRRDSAPQMTQDVNVMGALGSSGEPFTPKCGDAETVYCGSQVRAPGSCDRQEVIGRASSPASASLPQVARSPSAGNPGASQTRAVHGTPHRRRPS